jgi:hypothetical protein
MVANSVKRREFADLIVSSSGPRCDYTNDIARVAVYAAGPYDGRTALKVLDIAHQAFRALAAVMLHHGYAFRETAGGTLNCRYIGGTSVTSFHAHGIAGDWNPSKNRYRSFVGLINWSTMTDMPKAMVRDIESIKTVSGHSVFEWGGRWWSVKDPMHWELDLYRSQLLTGINLATLPAGAWARYLAFEAGGGTDVLPTEATMLGLDIGTTGDPVVESEQGGALQAFLVGEGYDLGDFGDNNDGVDNRPGNVTRAALHRWKVDNGITAATSGGEGKIGRYEYALMLRAGGTASTVDQTARSQAAAARTVAERADASATRANKTLDKIRSE